MFDKLKSVEKRFNYLNNFLSDPTVIAQQSDFQKYVREQAVQKAAACVESVACPCAELA